MGREGWAEEVGQQLVDALGLVVMNPVRGVGQALDAVEIGYVVVLGLGEFRTRYASRCPQMTRVGALMGRIAASASFAGFAPRNGSS